MGRKRILGGIIIIIGVIVFLSIILVERPDVLGNINYSYSKKTTNSSDFSFKGAKGDKLKFSFASKVVHGNLDIMLCDSQGNKIYELDRAKELVTYFTLEKTDTYTLVADYSDFIGKFKIRVAK